MPDVKAETFVLANKLIAAVTVIDPHGDLGVVDERSGNLIFRVL